MVLRKLGQTTLHTSLSVSKNFSNNSSIKTLAEHSFSPLVLSSTRLSKFSYAEPAWNGVKNKIDEISSRHPAVDFSDAVNIAVSLHQELMNSFIQAQKEKEQRADHMFGSIVREVLEKKEQISSLSKEEKIALKEKLSHAHNEYKDHNKSIKNVKEVSSFIQKALGGELRAVLEKSIDPKTIDMFCKVLHGSSRLATQAVPALRVLNQLSLAYDAAKILYPDHVAEIENYVVSTLKSTQMTTQETPDKNQQFKSFKDRFKTMNITATQTSPETRNEGKTETEQPSFKK